MHPGHVIRPLQRIPFGSSSVIGPLACDVDSTLLQLPYSFPRDDALGVDFVEVAHDVFLRG